MRKLFIAITSIMLLFCIGCGGDSSKIVNTESGTIYNSSNPPFYDKQSVIYRDNEYQKWKSGKFDASFSHPMLIKVNDDYCLIVADARYNEKLIGLYGNVDYWTKKDYVFTLNEK